MRDRSKRHEKLVLRSLDSSEREDFERRWADVQGQFVDDPSTGMAARRYPAEDFDQRPTIDR